jgi:metal transporter CNNM
MLLLTTLLLGNAAASSFFAILLGDMLHGVVAGMLSTILLFIFGEILPQAAVSRHALKFGEMEGLVHISELAWQRIENPKDIIKVADGGRDPEEICQERLHLMEAHAHHGKDREANSRDHDKCCKGKEIS